MEKCPPRRNLKSIASASRTPEDRAVTRFLWMHAAPPRSVAIPLIFPVPFTCRVYALRGGFKAWKRADLPFEPIVESQKSS